MPAKLPSNAKRLRKRFIEKGMTDFQPKEALELILGYFVSDKDLYIMIEELFTRFNTLNNILNASFEDLRSVPGITQEIALYITMIPYIQEITQDVNIPKDEVLGDSDDACEFFINAFKGITVEHIKIACLDRRLVAYECLDVSKGTTFGVNLNMKKICSMLKRLSCHCCVIAHNHPGGTCEPSSMDIEATRVLFKVLCENDIDLIDHIVVGTDGAMSIFTPNITIPFNELEYKIREREYRGRREKRMLEERERKARRR